MTDQDTRDWLEEHGQLTAPEIGLSDDHQHEFNMQVKYLHQRYPKAPGGYIELAAATNLLQVLAWRVQNTLRDREHDDTKVRAAVEAKVRAAEGPDADVATVLYQSLPFHEMDELAKEAEKLASTYKDEGSEQTQPGGTSRLDKLRKTANSGYAEAISNNDARLTKITAALEKYAQQFESFAENFGSEMHKHNREELQSGATLARHYSAIAKDLEPESPETWKRG